MCLWSSRNFSLFQFPGFFSLSQLFASFPLFPIVEVVIQLAFSYKELRSTWGIQESEGETVKNEKSALY